MDVVDKNLPIRLLNQKRLEEFRSACLARGVKPPAINNYFAQLRAALNWAKKEKYISEVPEIPFFKVNREEIPHFMLIDEIEKIMKVAKVKEPKFTAMIVFFLWTGARRDEARLLQWPDVHLDAGQPYVIVTGKGDKRRMIPLLDPVIEMLTSIRQDVGYVFTSRNKTRHWARGSVSDYFKRCARLAGCGDHHLHDTRHTAATYMLAKGIPMHIVQKILGHENITTTAKIYGGILTDSIFQEMRKLNYEKSQG
jgi:integrase/recombinase XerD